MGRRCAGRTCICAALLALPLCSVFGSQPDSIPCTLDRATGTSIDAQPFLREGYVARWSAAANRVAFMRPDVGGYYRVFTMRPDGSDRQRLELQSGAHHEGGPYWHPSGDFLLVLVQKSEWHGLKLFGVPDYEALPGFGRHDDLWLVSRDGSQRWQLTHEPNTVDEGILVAVFSPDGKRIAWSARQPGGRYLITLADFIDTPQPHLANLRTYRPGQGSYYETGSFSSDGRSLFYTSDQDTGSFWRSQIYRLDLAGGTSRRLTVGNDYNEHPTVLPTPSGDWVVYMSTRGVDRFGLQVMLGTDWYAMHPDGSGAKRLTNMNVNRKGNPESIGRMQVGGTVAPSPSGEFLLADVTSHLLRQSGMVKIVRFTCAPGAFGAAPNQE